MTQANKNANRSFLDKFQGRTNKVGKLGVHAVLTASKDVTSKQDQQSNQFRKVDLDAIIPSNPQKTAHKQATDNIVKRRESLNRPPLKSNEKQSYVPSAYTPQSTSKDESLSLASISNPGSPPSRSLSNSTGNSRNKYIFGKYLKLDKEALGHIEFMQAIEEKSFFRKNSRFSANLQ